MDFLDYIFRHQLDNHSDYLLIELPIQSSADEMGQGFENQHISAIRSADCSVRIDLLLHFGQKRTEKWQKLTKNAKIVAILKETAIGGGARSMICS